MNPDYISIADQRYRVEANWNAIVAFLEASGRDDMNALANIGQLKPSDLTILMEACIREGEALDGREFIYTAKDLGRLCDYSVITEFLTIYVKQSTPKVPEEPKKD